MSDSLWPFGLQHAMSFTISQSLLTLMSTESVMPSNQLILCLLVGLSLLWNMFYTEVNFGGHWTHSVQFSSVAQLCLTLCDPMNRARQASLSLTNSRSLPKLMSIESAVPSNHLILCYPLLLLPSIFPNIRVFSNELALCIRWPKYWSFSFNISPSNEHPGPISLRMDWLDLLAVQGTLKSLLQHHSSKASLASHKYSMNTYI